MSHRGVLVAMVTVALPQRFGMTSSAGCLSRTCESTSLKTRPRRWMYAHNPSETTRAAGHYHLSNGLECTPQVLSRGLDTRHVGATSMNRDSSRSHAVFTVVLQSKVCTLHCVYTWPRRENACYKLGLCVRRRFAITCRSCVRRASISLIWLGPSVRNYPKYVLWAQSRCVDQWKSLVCLLAPRRRERCSRRRPR